MRSGSCLCIVGTLKPGDEVGNVRLNDFEIAVFGHKIRRYHLLRRRHRHFEALAQRILQSLCGFHFGGQTTLMLFHSLTCSHGHPGMFEPVRVLGGSG